LLSLIVGMNHSYATCLE